MLFRTTNVTSAVLGMSWRGDASTSVRNLIQRPGRPPMEPTTFSAAFPWSRVLAVLDSHNDAEYVVDTRDLPPLKANRMPVNAP